MRFKTDGPIPSYHDLQQCTKCGGMMSRSQDSNADVVFDVKAKKAYYVHTQCKDPISPEP